MDPKIEPDCWDSIVVGSGLFECLIASALAKLGQSVLILDQEDTYGQEYASITLESLRQTAAGFPASLTAEADTNGPDAHAHNADMSTQAAELCGEDQAQGRSVPKGSIEMLTIALPGFKPPLHNFTHVTSSSFTQLPSKLFILDLMPKIMFQGEAMTEVLVKARAHHYLEFKRVEGSYMVTTAPQSIASATPPSTAVKLPDSNRQLTYMFRPVPASKSDIFKDKSLGLSEKRSLMTLLATAVEAGQGAGRLKDTLNSSSGSLVDVLISEGLSVELQKILVYGIAMCDFSQESTPCPPSVSFSTGIDHYKSSSPTPPPSNLTHPTIEGDQLHAHVKSHEALGTTAHKMTACEGLQALQLMAESVVRFSSPGAFMLPSWGCGSLPEAFVRCCAVNGGTTVLKCRVTAAVLRKGHGPTPPTQSVNTEKGCGDAIAALDLSDAACPEGHKVQRQIIREDIGVSKDSTEDRWHVESVCTAGGQVLRCKHLVTSPSVLNALNEALARADPAVRSTCSIPPLSQHPASSVHRALVIMEGSLVNGQNAITFVIPPHSQLLGGGNRHPIRGLQLGPSLSVSPENRYLLYLSCPAIGSLPVDQSTHLTAFQVLHPAVHLLTQPAVQEVGPGQVNSENDQGSGNSVTDKRPRAVEVFYYSQTSEVVSGPSGPLVNVVANESSLSPLGLVGYSSVLEAAEAAFRKYFPDQEWLSDIDLEQVKGTDDVEEDAVEDLEAALGQLQALKDVEKT
ncbi:hypothetical protein CEUSTIGMA_g10936.t1 [Chlamydomonas eustigma]|uniref:Rab proteins geranylgeranyltransferase component n=1 Tax=Chlamydomonas eustigma TaxID=1157962 RepID=A0A250XKA2_9CHLO|nr:hypothetical protein CEUSTIGMA_g10936.t1 [Chlamydomonas eustigma]|eukprot:GAX83511.1 hypothetical protein CEUSTIGMA_g10936.t1 [Chlamydomonas eustigma]